MSAALAIALAIICLAGGGLLGFLLGRGGGSNKKRAEALEQEFDDYKRNVTEHFGKTAEHFQNIGRQYRELYDHMASGASSLCEEDDRTRLAFPSLLTIEAVAEPNPAVAPPRDAATDELDDDGDTAADESAAPAGDEAAETESGAGVEGGEPAEAAAGDDADDEIKVEVDVEVIDDGEPGPKKDAVGAAPRADTTDLDSTDDAEATRH